MRILLIVAWLFTGLAGVIYHFGPGQEQLEIDRINSTLKQARQNIASENWLTAIEDFDTVLAELPPEKTKEARGVILEKAKAQMMAAELPKARESLETLLSDVRKDETIDEAFAAEVQLALASSQYYMTWLMRLEGMPEAEWMPEIQAARQHYAQLAKSAEKNGDKELQQCSTEDLESAIRLARMDISELQGLPLPSQ